MALTIARAVQSPSSVSTRKRSSSVRETARDPDRPVHGQVEAALVLGEVRGDDVGGPQARRSPGSKRQAGQVVHAVGGADGQRRPAVLPRAAGRVVGVQDDEAGLRLEALARQRPGGAQPGLAGADDDDVDVPRMPVVLLTSGTRRRDRSGFPRASGGGHRALRNVVSTRRSRPCRRHHGAGIRTRARAAR